MTLCKKDGFVLCTSGVCIACCLFFKLYGLAKGVMMVERSS